MRIIIIEDDENKLNHITDFIKNDYPGTQIDIYNSYRSGLKAIFEDYEKTDLILLDMSMNTYNVTAYETGGRKRPFAGRDILDQMKWNDIVAPVVIVTAYETFEEYGRKFTLAELCSEMEKSFLGLYLGCVYFDSSQRNWMDHLGSFIKQRNEDINAKNTNS